MSDASHKKKRKRGEEEDNDDTEQARGIRNKFKKRKKRS